MSLEFKPKFSAYQLVCHILIWLLRPLTVPIEMFIHINPGERYPGFSSLAALALMGICAEFCPPDQSLMIYLLMTAFIVRLIVHRVLCIRRRVCGDLPLVHSRLDPGHPLLQLLVPKMPQHLIQWVEPILVIFACSAIKASNETLGEYLMWSGGALLCITAIRSTAGYNHRLDLLDAQIEEEADEAIVHHHPVPSHQHEIAPIEFRAHEPLPTEAIAVLTEQ